LLDLNPRHPDSQNGGFTLSITDRLVGLFIVTVSLLALVEWRNLSARNVARGSAAVVVAVQLGHATFNDQRRSERIHIALA
jgi:hypothetical protein